VCAISGWFIGNANTLALQDMESMLGTQHHRGPDDSGFFQDQSKGLVLGHNRLSILDLSVHGHQPMRNENTGDVLVFNGEIYNYKELRGKLQQRGHQFHSRCDTEVLLYSFAEWGIGCLDRIKGMFAFALWSPANETLHLVRDPMGIKPLYYWRLPRNGGIAFASEIKAFLSLPGFPSTINKKSLTQFLEFGYTFDQQETIFKDVYKLAPGHRIKLQHGSQVAMQRYYFPDLSQVDGQNVREAEDNLFSTLNQIVGEHLVADVPVGMLLSGGLDSSIIASIASRQGHIHTYSMGFAESRVDERPYARLVSEFIGSSHEEILIQPQELLTDLEQTIVHFDDLFADWGMLSTRLLYQKCRQKGVKVVIVGEGADELFGGYDIFRHALPEHAGMPMEWRLFQLYRAYAGRRYGSLFISFRRRMRGYLEMTDGDLFGAIRLFESRDQLPNNYVMKVDKASMSVSVEARVPFLDSRVAEIAYRVPGEMLIDRDSEKKLLRSMAQRHGLLPQELLQRKKFGAGVAANWMDDSPAFRQYARDVILQEDSLVDQLRLRRPMQRYFDHDERGYSFPRAISIFRNLAWRLLILNLWAKTYRVSTRHA
jgi:asparagine synthase (glutamine-hydrolysing)